MKDTHTPGQLAALYGRFSTDKQDSLDVQFAKMEAYCAAHGLATSPEHYYSDKALTGMRTRRRRGYNDMLSAAARHEFDCIVLYDMSRGNREVANWFTFRRQMKVLGILVYSLGEHLGDIDDPADFLPELISAGLSQQHVLVSRRKSMDKVDLLARQGRFLGGYPPLGYRIENGVYIIQEPEAGYIRTIFSMYAAGHSYSEILDALPTGLLGARGRPIGKNSLSTILRNERYMGRYTWCKRKVKYFSEWAGGGPSDRAVVIEDAIPPIIDKETWKAVQKRTMQNTKNRTNHGKRSYLLSGLLYCGRCGSAMTGVTTTNKRDYAYSFYACGDKYRTRQCKLKNIAANDIEPLVVNLLRHSLLDSSIIEETADAIWSAANTQHTVSDIEAARSELAKTEVEIGNLPRALTGGFESPSVKEEITKLKVRNRTLQLKIETLQPFTGITKAQLIEALRADAQRLTNAPSAINELLHKYIVRINIHDDTIEIISTADFADAAPTKLFFDEDAKKAYAASQTADGISTIGCGGRI